jgi:hypothetical protein
LLASRGYEYDGFLDFLNSIVFKEKAEVLASFFSSVFTIEPEGDLPLMHPIEIKQECIEKTYKEMFPSFHSLGTKPWHIDELNIVVIGFDIVALSSFSILG